MARDIQMIERQQSFQESKPTVYIVATPIGNLQELTPRAVEILSSVDIIAAEDTRHTFKLLQYFNIKTKCIAHHLHNERESSKGILKLLEANKSIALVSDAGYPLLSDPGQSLIQSVIAAGYPVVPISGSSAILNAVVASGLCAQPFLFYGFLDASEGKRMKALQSLGNSPYTTIFYEAPHRIHKMLQSMYAVFGNRKVCIARELTKQYEEFIRGDLIDVIAVSESLKGELVVVVEGMYENIEVDMEDILEVVKKRIEAGESSKGAIKQVAAEYGIAKNILYAEFHKKTV